MWSRAHFPRARSLPETHQSLDSQWGTLCPGSVLCQSPHLPLHSGQGGDLPPPECPSQSSTGWGGEGAPAEQGNMSKETSRPYRVCLYVCLCLGQPLLWGKTETSEVHVSGCHHRSPALPIFPIALARADDGGSQGNARGGLACTSSSSPPCCALPGLYSRGRIRISLLMICQKDQDLEPFPLEAKTNHFFPLL